MLRVLMKPGRMKSSITTPMIDNIGTAGNTYLDTPTGEYILLGYNRKHVWCWYLKLGLVEEASRILIASFEPLIS